MRTAVIERRKLCIESYDKTYFTFSMIIFLTMDHYQKIFICLIKKMKLKSLNFLKEVMMMKIPMRKKIKSRMRKIQTKNRKPVSIIGWNLLQSLFYITQKSSSRTTLAKDISLISKIKDRILFKIKDINMINKVKVTFLTR